MSLVLAVGGIGISLLSLLLSPGWQVVGLTLGSAILAVGVISVAYDVNLQRALTEYIYDLIQLERNVAEVGLREVGEDFRFDWSDFLDGASECTAVLPNPSAWMNTAWPHVLATGRKHKIAIEVMLPEPAGASAADNAHRLDLTEDEYRANATAAFTKLKQDFHFEKTNSSFVAGSTLSIRYFDELVAYAMIATDREIVVLIGSAGTKGPGEGVLSLRFQRDTSKRPSQLVERQLERMRRTLNSTWADST